MIACDCRVCTSTDPRNKRRRTSLYVQTDAAAVVVDTTPDFREQCLTHGVRRIDAVLLTHTHADHIMGFDDVRQFNPPKGSVLPIYGTAPVLEDMRRIFGYAEEDGPGYRPRVGFTEIDGPMHVGDLTVRAVEVEHSPQPTVGFHFAHAGRTLGYVSDCNALPPAAREAFAGVDVMVLDGLRPRPHYSHFSIDQALEALADLAPKAAYLVHMNHEVDHAETEAALPPPVRLGYDGLTLTI